ncbi:SIR2 family protein [Bradyrhizobium sp. SZCCHNR3107]|uniref:SIR2 family protein n=1 Tax=Bradyrhizobium sp. SZCCHNR3107 TaxID=3057459 RepID=UPI0028E4AD54|nr:SIR2 family protein [Bradyrhizobium sp. SZCCHNR3107]
MIDPLHSLAFSIYENPGVYCVLLGSGASRSAEIPTGWEITLDLVRRVAALDGVTDEPDLVAWYRRAHGAEPGYSELLDQLASTPDERRSILHSYIEPTAEDIEVGRKIPTKAHRAVARLVQAGYLRVILTTNFDRLMEGALREVGIEPTVIASEDDLMGAVPLIHARCYVVKLHGDYLDTRILNTEQELSSYSDSQNTLLDRIVDEHGLIVTGWSGDWDHALRAAITRAPSRRYPMYWASRGEPSTIGADLVGRRAGKIIPIESADSFFERLERLVASQAELKKQNPRSIELLVASTKRFLAKPEFRIQLGDLIGEEVRKLEGLLNSNDFDLNADETLVQRSARFESVTEPLARIAGILGKWGDGSESGLAIELISLFGTKESAGGFLHLIALRNYSAVLVLYAYGLGLFAARRYSELFKLFSTSLAAERHTETTFVSHLLLNAWEGGQRKGDWQGLPGFNRRKTPLSDHLHDIFMDWTTDYLFAKQGYTELFEEFELLGSLAFISVTNGKEELHRVTNAAASDRNFVWCPIGRVSWHTQNFSKVIEKWKLAAYADELLKAGFAKSDRAYFDLAIVSLTRLAARLDWE